MKLPLPLYQHPTMVVLVDDSASFVASLEFQMNPLVAVKSFAGSVEALRWIFAALRYERDRFAVTEAELPSAVEPTEIAEVNRLVFDPLRFAIPAVVVVDYAMPHIDGLDFCRALDGLPCKKILFTGEADEMVAVEAFNSGLIDRYLKKGDPEAMDRLGLEITALERQFFLEKSKIMRTQLIRSGFDFLTDEAFVRLVQALMRRHGFVEHYAFPDPTGILFFDSDGVPKLMVMETHVGYVSHQEAAEGYDAPADLQEALREHSVVPFFWRSGGMYNQGLGDWRAHVAPANICEGKETYYWAMFDLPPELFSAPVYPYRQFLCDRAQTIWDMHERT